MKRTSSALVHRARSFFYESSGKFSRANRRVCGREGVRSNKVVKQVRDAASVIYLNQTIIIIFLRMDPELLIGGQCRLGMPRY